LFNVVFSKKEPAPVLPKPAASRLGHFVSAVAHLIGRNREENVMVLGMSLATFTVVHVVISLIGIISGILVLFGLFGSNRMSGMTALFLIATILTSVTGFLFPFEKLLPSHIVGIISLIMLAIACIALYVMKLSGSWRWIYTLTALIALYLNVFVLIIQSFLKIAPLHALAPSVPPSEPPFAIAQGIVLVLFVVAIIRAARRFRPA
jgi:MFS family permease